MWTIFQRKIRSANIPELGVNLLVTRKQNFNSAFVIFLAGYEFSKAEDNMLVWSYPNLKFNSLFRCYLY
jgi:hypothetical protein